MPAAWLCLAASRAPRQLARAAAPGNALPLALFIIHYFYRGLIYPLRVRGGRPTPAAVWGMAAAFCAYNGFMQVRAGRRWGSWGMIAVWGALGCLQLPHFASPA